jgi:hypothetical protein
MESHDSEGTYPLLAKMGGHYAPSISAAETATEVYRWRDSELIVLCITSVGELTSFDLPSS